MRDVTIELEGSSPIVRNHLALHEVLLQTLTLRLEYTQYFRGVHLAGPYVRLAMKYASAGCTSYVRDCVCKTVRGVALPV